MARQCMGVVVDYRVAYIGSSEMAPMLQQPQLGQPTPLDSPVSCKQLERVIIGKDADEYFQVGIQIPIEDKKQLMDFLKGNLDVFA